MENLMENKKNLTHKFFMKDIFWVFGKKGEFVLPVAFNQDKTKIVDLNDGEVIVLTDSDSYVDIVDGEYVMYHYNARRVIANKYHFDIKNISMEDSAWMFYDYTKHGPTSKSFLAVKFKVLFEQLMDVYRFDTFREALRNKKVSGMQLKSIVKQLKNGVEEKYIENKRRKY